MNKKAPLCPLCYEDCVLETKYNKARYTCPNCGYSPFSIPSSSDEKTAAAVHEGASELLDYTLRYILYKNMKSDEIHNALNPLLSLSYKDSKKSLIGSKYYPALIAFLEKVFTRGLTDDK